jgi:glycosyltransferase involved in cell wall biosynthesis
LTIYGNGPERKGLIQLAEKLRVHLSLPGIVSNEELPFLLRQNQLFVMTSLREGHPKALLEAMACGLPCIGTDVVGIRECLLESSGGILVVSDPQLLGETIAKLLDDPDLRHHLGENGTIYVKNTMKSSIIFQKKKAILESCLSHV